MQDVGALEPDPDPAWQLGSTLYCNNFESQFSCERPETVAEADCRDVTDRILEQMLAARAFPQPL